MCDVHVCAWCGVCGVVWVVYESVGTFEVSVVCVVSSTRSGVECLLFSECSNAPWLTDTTVLDEIQGLQCCRWQFTEHVNR